MNNQPFKIFDINNQKLQLCQEGINKLKQIKGYVFPICSVGPILTGKSSLLNELLGKKIFKTGDTTIPTTKGVYAYIHQIKLQHLAVPISYIYLDAQGFDNSFSSNNEQADLQLMLIMVSICKVIMYNSFGALQSKTLQRVASLNELVPTELKNTPYLIMVQKNFNLKLSNKDNQLLSAQQYLGHCLRLFKQKSTINKLNSMFRNRNNCSHLNCILLPNTGQSAKYSREIASFQLYLQSLLMKQLKISDQNNESRLIDSVNFISSIIKCIQLRNNKSTLKQLYTFVQKQRQQQSRTSLTTYKSSLIQKCKHQIKYHFPMPEQLITFKFKKASNQCLQSLGKGQSNFFIQLISSDLIEQFCKKKIQKLKQQNYQKLKQFLGEKVKEMINELKLQSVQSIKMNLKKQKIQNKIEILRNYYSFVNENHADFIRSLIFKEISYNLCQQIQNITQQNTLSTQKNANYEQQLQKNTMKIKEKSEQIRKLNLQIQKYRSQNKIREDSQRKREEQCKRLKIQAETQIRKIHQTVQYNSQNGQTLLREIQNQLRENLMFQKTNKQQIQEKQSDTNSKCILQSVNKVLQLLETNQNKMKQDEKMYIEKLVSLEKMNKRLRERLQQLIVEGNSSEVMERKYSELQHELIRKQRQFEKNINEKQLVIEKIRNQLRVNQESMLYVQSELSMMRDRAIDKGKTSEFMEKILKSKQKLLQQARQQITNNLTKHKQQIHLIKTEYREKELQLSNSLSMFVVQNQQLVSKNSDLSNKIALSSTKLKKQHQQNLLQKQKQVHNLNEQLRKMQNNLASATDSYMQVTKNMEKIIKQKDEIIQKINDKVQKIQKEFIKIQKQLIQQKQKVVQLKQKHKIAELCKQQLQSKIKREQILTNNRIKHMEQTNQKLKVQIKQKQSTFDLMLLQLRSNNIVTNNSLNSNNMIKQNNREKYMKRIDHLESLAIKQLEQISNKNVNKQVSMSRAYTHARSARKNTKNDQNSGIAYQKHLYVTDKKPNKQIISTFSDFKTLTTSNLSSNLNSSSTILRNQIRKH